jgi:glyoxylase-like metal-dependent hydrolase (beta-lactamase superfamily II)
MKIFIKSLLKQIFMKLYAIDTGYFKLDGGAMFGVVPKTLWNKLNPADENNMCTWAMRCLLVEEGNRLILIDTGIGNKQDEQFFSRYYLHGENSLEGSLHKLGFTPKDVSDVFLTHLHFDHCGGATRWNGSRTGCETVFSNATYYSNASHWDWSIVPNTREKASFLKENILPIKASGQLSFVKNGDLPFTHLTVNGHTQEMMLPVIKYGKHTIVYMADLIPSVGHISLPYVMAYDMSPLVTLEEKERFLNEAVDNNYTLFFEHDPTIECCTVKRTGRGRFEVDRQFSLNEIN